MTAQTQTPAHGISFLLENRCVCCITEEYAPFYAGQSGAIALAVSSRPFCNWHVPYAWSRAGPIKDSAKDWDLRAEGWHFSDLTNTMSLLFIVILSFLNDVSLQA